MDRLATYDFLLVIHSNQGTISYHFHDKWSNNQKLQNVPTPAYLTAPLWGFPLEFCKASGADKN